MAESAVFSLASKILSTIASPAFDKAYERGLSIWEARDELDKLRETIGTIEAVLLDAEKKQKGSAAVKNWIKRLKGVLYDAEDLFDEVATDDLIKQHMMEGSNKLSLKKKVRVSCSKLNPIVYRDSITKKVKAIRKSLSEISKDMAELGLLRCQHEEPLFGMRVEKDPGSFVDPKHVFGRDEDKKTILETLFKESNDVDSDVPTVISIVGIGGMGKTTLAQLIYNDEEVRKNFSNRWFACISDTSDEKEVLGKIFQSICEENYSGLTVSQLQIKIRRLVEDKTFLLVLDDVWDEDHARWQHRMSLLGCGAKGSKIIVTTRSSSVAIAIDAFKTHILNGLSEDDSWDLFKSVAFTPKRENDRRWTTLGRKIVKKCAGVPLAIRSIGSLLYTKTTIQEWESFRDQELSKLREQSDSESIMPVLELSYDHLPSNLKYCFAYCSIFPKDFVFDVQKLVYLWTAQGYIKPNEGESVEVAGRSYFMSLLRRSFFQEPEEDFGEIYRCKMHDLVHDLAQYVAGKEIVMLTTPCSRYDNSARHVSIGCGTGSVGDILPRVLNMSRLRSLFVLEIKELCLLPALDQQLRSGKYLRALSLSYLGIENVPSSIGELKLLRYLDLSSNKFKRLPDSLTNLLNLVALDVFWCRELEALPNDFKKLINLMYLDTGACVKLKHMPPGFGELYSLRYLSDFKVGKATRKEEEGVESKTSGLDALAGLRQLRGELTIQFEDGIGDWDRDECSWQLPVSPQRLFMYNYPGSRIPHWANDRASQQVHNLVDIKLDNCLKVKYLPYFRYLPYLKSLVIVKMEELEYMEEEEKMNERATGFVNDASLFFPSLEKLDLSGLSKLKGWSRMNYIAKTSTTPMQQHQHLLFPILSTIWILGCPELKSMPSSPRICELRLVNVCGEMVEELLSSTSSSSTTPSSSSSSCLKEMIIRNCRGPISFLGLTLASFTYVEISSCCWPISFSGVAFTSLQHLEINMVADLEILPLASPHLKRVTLSDCDGLTSVQVEASDLGLRIDLMHCNQLKNLHFAHPNVLEELLIYGCKELWSGSVDWDSLSNLRLLKLYSLPSPEELPECIIHRQSLGNLEIITS